MATRLLLGVNVDTALVIGQLADDNVHIVKQVVARHDSYSCSFN